VQWCVVYQLCFRRLLLVLLLLLLLLLQADPGVL
jgi:hypothetical protein